MKKKQPINWNMPLALDKPTSDLYSEIKVNTINEDTKIVEVLFYHKDNQDYCDLICFDFDKSIPISGAYNSLLFS